MNKKCEINFNKEYIEENESSFIILFDSKNNKLNLIIPKSKISTRESAINTILDLSNNSIIHNRIDKDIYKELYYKINKYIDKLKYKIL